jgi:hypothetical protein
VRIIISIITSGLLSSENKKLPTFDVPVGLMNIGGHDFAYKKKE